MQDAESERVKAVQGMRKAALQRLHMPVTPHWLVAAHRVAKASGRIQRVQRCRKSRECARLPSRGCFCV